MPLIYAVNGISSPYDPTTAIYALFPGSMSRSIHAESSEPLPLLVSNHPKDPSQQRPKIKGYDDTTHSHSPDRKPALRARDIMTKNVFHLKESAPLTQAREQMQKLQIRHIPILSADETLVGILSDRDILRAGSALEGLVSDQMTHHVLTATPETPIREIADAMLTHQIHALPITNPELRIVGILSSTDILRAIVQRAPLELWI